jgi:BirA family biotin operon repressor/biotin-[acetyl-CoA-carboxylase] ligase
LYKIPANTLLLGKNLIFVPECHSTNTLLFELTQKTIQPEGTLVITNHQTKGRGQRGNSWIAEEGKNLTLSILLKPRFISAKDQFYLTIVSALGILDYLTERGIANAKIKWPNDLMVSSKKIAGILIENVVAGDRLQQSIVGIGLNINQSDFQMEKATSMVNELNRQFDLVNDFQLLVEKLEIRYLQLQSGKALELKNEYLKNLFWIGEEHLFLTCDQEFEGRIVGVEEDGKLSIVTKGLITSYDLKDIKFVI